jgi:hypothetical protein
VWQIRGDEVPVKKSSGFVISVRDAPNFCWDLIFEAKLHAGTEIRSPIDPTGLSRTETVMAVVAYVLLTVSVFAALGLAQKLVEKL